MPLNEQNMIIGDPLFKNAGGLEAEHYIPLNASLIRDKGIAIPQVEGDEVGLRVGLDVTEDFFGNPITGMPDIGAIEISR